MTAKPPPPPQKTTVKTPRTQSGSGGNGKHSTPIKSPTPDKGNVNTTPKPQTNPN